MVRVPEEPAETQDRDYSNGDHNWAQAWHYRHCSDNTSFSSSFIGLQLAVSLKTTYRAPYTNISVDRWFKVLGSSVCTPANSSAEVSRVSGLPYSKSRKGRRLDGMQASPYLDCSGKLDHLGRPGNPQSSPEIIPSNDLTNLVFRNAFNDGAPVLLSTGELTQQT
jgi:hypothetical protein